MSKRPSRPWDKTRNSNNPHTGTCNKNIKQQHPNLIRSNIAANNGNDNKKQTNDTNDHPTNYSSADAAFGRNEIPYIEIDDIKYYSDRFYLNRTIYDADPSVESNTVPSNTTNHYCTCGAKQAPPVLDIPKLINSISDTIEAVIIGTFSYDISYLQRTFPKLFGPNATIPILVQHGKKGQNGENTEDKTGDENFCSYGDYEPESEPSLPKNNIMIDFDSKEKSSESNNNRCNDTDDDGLVSLLTQEPFSNHNTPIKQIKRDYARNVADLNQNHTKEAVAIPLMCDNIDKTTDGLIARENDDTPLSNRYHDGINRCERKLPETAHFSEVQPLWVRPSSGSKNNDYGGKEITYKQGVHHPKYMIVFEKSGSIIVLVSTANFTTRPTTVDGTWLQRFYPQSTSKLSSPRKRAHPVMQNIIPMPNDFGAVLSNFLYCETLGTKSNQVMSSLQFVQKYLQWKSLRELDYRYDYSTCQVYLIPVVPGDYDGRNLKRQTNEKQQGRQRNSRMDHQIINPSEPSGLQCEGTKTKDLAFLYGRQRVAFILESLCSSLSPTIPQDLVSDKDRLIFQATSFGAEWDPSSMSNVIRSYLNIASASTNEMDRQQQQRPKPVSHQTSGISDQFMLERMDIVWPTESFIESVRQQNKATIKSKRKCRRESPKTVQDDIMEYRDDDAPTPIKQIEESIKLDKKNEGYLFLSSEAFNSIDLACLSQMVQYETSHPIQTKYEMIPHFKSVCRLFNGNEYRLRTNLNVHGKAEEYFSWFLLTSACLSRGAQGIDTTGRLPNSTSVSYSNFELGILFVSQVTKYDPRAKKNQANTDRRVYCWKPTTCSCKHNIDKVKSTSAVTRTIHLPVPYCLRPSRYQDDFDEAEFCQTPYFHEVLPGTGCVGHMLLTPYGSAIANEYKKKGI